MNQQVLGVISTVATVVGIVATIAQQVVRSETMKNEVAKQVDEALSKRG